MIEMISIKRRKSLGMTDKGFEKVAILITGIVLLAVLYPIIFVISASFSSGNALLEGRVLLWPVEVGLQGYEMVFSNKMVLTGLTNSTLYTILRMLLSLTLTILAAYPLSRKSFGIRNILMLVFMFPNWFDGGLIATYLWNNTVGLVNNQLGYVFMVCVGAGSIIMLRTYFQHSIPDALLEAAKVDGISEFGYLRKVALPLAKPILAVLILNFTVGNWNDYTGPMIYLRNPDYYTLGQVVRSIVITNKMDASVMKDPTLLNKYSGLQEVTKYSLIVITTVPMLILYAFIRKFFEKGMVIGAIKG